MSKRKMAFTYMNLGRDSLLSQEELNREFSAKASQLLRYSGVLLGLALAIIQFGCGIDCEKTSGLHFDVFILTSQGILFLLIAILCSVVMAPRKWHGFPNMDNTAKKLHDCPVAEFHEELGDKYNNATTQNRIILWQRSLLISVSGILTVVQTMLLAISVMFRLYV